MRGIITTINGGATINRTPDHPRSCQCRVYKQFAFQLNPITNKLRNGSGAVCALYELIHSV